MMDGGKMTIDERLEKLAERHEALTQTVEILTRVIQELAAMVRSHELRIHNLEGRPPQP